MLKPKKKNISNSIRLRKKSSKSKESCLKQKENEKKKWNTKKANKMIISIIETNVKQLQIFFIDIKSTSNTKKKNQLKTNKQLITYKRATDCKHARNNYFVEVNKMPNDIGWLSRFVYEIAEPWN